MASSWGKSWGKSWGNSWGLIGIEGGGAVKTRVKPTYEDEEEYTEVEAKGMAAVYGSGFTKEKEVEEEIIGEVEPVIETPPLEVESFPDDYLSFKENLALLEAQVELNPEMRKELEFTQDIGLILAIIEAID